MNFEIRDYRRIQKTSVEIERLTVLGGKNDNGKSSALGAIASVMTGEPVPFSNFLKKSHKQLISKNAKRAFIECQDGNTISKIEYPDCKYTSGGKKELISKYSAGLISLVDLNKKELNNYLMEKSGKMPNDADLMSEMKRQGLYSAETVVGTEEEFKKLWVDIELNGWDTIWEDRKKQGAKLKGEWEYITGEKRFGVRIAADWAPEGYSAEDLETSCPDALQAELDSYNEWLKAAELDTALSERDVQKYNELAKKEKPCKDRIALIEKQIERIKKDIATAKKKHVIVAGLVCPHCTTPLSLQDGKLKLSDPKDETAEHGGHDHLENLELSLRAQVQRKTKGEYLLAEIVKAKTSLSKMESGEQSQEDETKIEQTKEKVVVIKNKLKAIEVHCRASAVYRKILRMGSIVNILAPSGLRLNKLSLELDRCNKLLAKMCETFGFWNVKINSDLTITSNGIGYHKLLLSRAERFFVDAIFQILVAVIEKDNLVIIDDVDILTKEKRILFIKMLLNPMFKDKKFIISLAYDKKEEFPNVSKIPGCKSYWINNGVSEEMGG